MSHTLEVIEQKALLLSMARSRLGDLVQQLNAELEVLKGEQMPAIRVAIAQALVAWKTLDVGIQASPDLFVRPRTVAAHGITFGLAKSKGSLEIPDPDKTVALIRRHFPEQAAVLIQTKEMPVKKALEQMTAAELKRLSVQVGEGQGQVVIRPAASDVDKLVRALVRSEAEADAEKVPA